METVPLSVTEWLSATQEPSPFPPRPKRLLAHCKDTVARKRRQLNEHSQRRRERSWSEGDAALLPELPKSSTEELFRSATGSPRSAGFPELNAGDMMNPPTTPSSAKRRALTPSQVSPFPARSNTSGRDANDGIKSSTYRDGVLDLNGVTFRHERLPLPVAVAQQCADWVLSKKCEETLMSLAEAEKLSDELFAIDAEEEHHFLQALNHPGPFPPIRSADPQFKDMRCTNGRSFKDEAVPGSIALVFAKIVRPKPDYAYGYKMQCFSHNQRNVLEHSSIYQTAAGLLCPFLIIEGKSQACGLNVWQASNQCAGGGSACVKVALTLVGQQSDQAKDGLKEADCTSYSVAVDTVAAILYVHWSPEPGQYVLQCIDQYWIRRPSDLIRLQTHLYNIMTWGLGHRLGKIKRSVDAILEGQDKNRKRTIESVEE